MLGFLSASLTHRKLYRFNTSVVQQQFNFSTCDPILSPARDVLRWLSDARRMGVFDVAAPFFDILVFFYRSQQTEAPRLCSIFIFSLKPANGSEAARKHWDPKSHRKRTRSRRAVEKEVVFGSGKWRRWEFSRRWAGG